MGRVTSDIPQPSPGTRFGDAVEAVLDHLHAVLPVACWLVTRQDGSQQRYIHVRGDASSVTAADAYVGAELRRSNGELFGALAGFGASPQPAALAEHTALVTLFAQLLTSILEADLALTEHLRTIEQAQRATEVDALTGLLNRDAWEHYVELEEGRHRNFGESSAVIVAELDRVSDIREHRGTDAADRYIVNAGTALRNTVRGADVVARIGDQELAVIVNGISAKECELLVDRIHDAFRSAGVSGFIGWAPDAIDGGLSGAVAVACSAVEDDKAQRRARATRLVLVR